MGYKKLDTSSSFADLALESTIKNNRGLKQLQDINGQIDWSRVEQLPFSFYTVGTSSQGANAYTSLLLLKCMLMQKWFNIDSDPELENQINDRMSFKKFTGIPLDHHSPDHSTFCRFRSRISKEGMDLINSDILRQFEAKGVIINEGVAIDARLVKSASRPVSNEKLEDLRQAHNTDEGRLDKNGKPKKFCRDLESDWVVQKDTPQYGLKEHAAVDTNTGFILATTITPALVSDTTYLPYCTIYSRHTKQPIKKVFADKGYAGRPNRDFLADNHIADGIMRKDTTTAKLTDRN
jgi:IS5 family transposase